MLMHVRKEAVKNSLPSGRTTGSDDTRVDIGSGQWHAAVGSGSGGTATSGYTEGSYELRTRASRTVRIVDLSDADAELGNGKGKDVAAVHLTSIGTYSDGRGPDSPGKLHVGRCGRVCD